MECDDERIHMASGHQLWKVGRDLFLFVWDVLSRLIKRQADLETGC